MALIDQYIYIYIYIYVFVTWVLLQFGINELGGALNAALQARSVYSWECLSPDGFALNSKWNEAEKYICNPLSGEVPMECLSAKTLSGRSFRSLTSRITMSAPLVYPSHSKLLIQTKPYKNTSTLEAHEAHFPIQGPKLSVFLYI